jgi:hypothetical protein
MSALTGGVELSKLAGATAATIILGAVSSTVAAMKIKKALSFSIDSIWESATLIGAILGLIGLTILICGCIPDNTSEGPDNPIDRKYSLLFFGLTAYSFLFSFLTNRKIKPSRP